MSSAWSIAYGREAEHAVRLKQGLAALPRGFVAEICWACHGRGEREQTFTAGCGGGYYKIHAGCDYCDGTGLLQGDKPAPASVREQVLNARPEPIAGEERS
jgi:DnaJ-class molecular chaperone